jgi:hypothetical protein
MIVIKTTINSLIDLRKMMLDRAYAMEAPKAKNNFIKALALTYLI